jgi:hypothetical protein
MRSHHYMHDLALLSPSYCIKEAGDARFRNSRSPANHSRWQFWLAYQEQGKRCLKVLAFAFASDTTPCRVGTKKRCLLNPTKIR